MKIRLAMSLFVLAIGFVTGPQAVAQVGPIPSGSFSMTAAGTEASCSGPSSCVTLNIIEVGTVFRDGAGNGCGTHAAVVNTIPPGDLAPTVVPAVSLVFKLKNFDPITGTGDESLTEYIGGSCHGSFFNGTGATPATSGALHFVISDRGNRIDSIVTALTIGGAGVPGFSLTFTERRQ